MDPANKYELGPDYLNEFIQRLPEDGGHPEAAKFANFMANAVPDNDSGIYRGAVVQRDAIDYVVLGTLTDKKVSLMQVSKGDDFCKREDLPMDSLVAMVTGGSATVCNEQYSRELLEKLP